MSVGCKISICPLLQNHLVSWFNGNILYHFQFVIQIARQRMSHFSHFDPKIYLTNGTASTASIWQMSNGKNQKGTGVHDGMGVEGWFGAVGVV